MFQGFQEETYDPNDDLEMSDLEFFDSDDDDSDNDDSDTGYYVAQEDSSSGTQLLLPLEPSSTPESEFKLRPDQNSSMENTGTRWLAYPDPEVPRNNLPFNKIPHIMVLGLPNLYQDEYLYTPISRVPNKVYYFPSANEYTCSIVNI
ncbi:hypothetical protein DMENIID0001_047300 [Sergentomyia squamirostris]